MLYDIYNIQHEKYCILYLKLKYIYLYFLNPFAMIKKHVYIYTMYINISICFKLVMSVVFYLVGHFN